MKTGIDPGANLVDTEYPVPITVAQLNGLLQCRDDAPAWNNQQRVRKERVIYQVQGRLVMLKNESDNDHHLVITDDSLQFKPGGPETEGQETGKSFIAEIPRSDCVGGKQGSAPAVKGVQSALDARRNKFEESFANGKGADTDLGGITVSLMGVAFYDSQHNQTGRAGNGIQLLPLLDIAFWDGGEPALGTPTELLAKPGSEGVTGWKGTTSAFANYPQQPAHGGSQVACLDDYGHGVTETLAQRIIIPSTASMTNLSFWLKIETEEVTISKKHDTLAVQVGNSGDAVLKTLASYSNLDATPGCVQKTFNLTEFEGQSIEIFLSGSEDRLKAT